jgi:N-methylhydantoinase B
MTAVDPITLEVLRNRLEAIGEEAAAALERTAISPVVTESKDYSCTLLDGAGRLVIGAGQIQFHFRAASHAVQSTMARFGDEIDDGDVFVANDPHHGGGLHPQDVMVQRPVFVDGHRVAWVVMSAHMMDVGGMVAGSFAPAATECYQEALRLPPVRLFRKGREETGIWDVFRNNIRLPALVEMDMRSLVAGCHVAQDNIAGVVASMGVDTFVESIETTRRLSEAEMRRRIGLLADGRYRATSWTEWDDEFFKVPCELTVAGDRLVFDFSGASPQTNHFFNSKPYIIESEMVAQLAWLLARDLPYDDGIFAPIELRCPEGTIVNSVEPAPIAAAHMDVALNASEVGVQCVRLALGASPDHPARRYLSGWGPGSALGLHTWSCAGIDGRADAFIMLDGNWVGSSASGERDGLPLAGSILGPDHGYSFTDIEILESWYPILISEKRSRPGVNGAGRHRAGGGNQMGFRPHGTPQLTGAMLGMRRWLPLEGAGGGLPGNRTEFLVHRADGVTEAVPTHASGIVIGEGDTFQFRCASGGGFGDPLDRDPELVMRDIELFALSPAEAEAVYGVLVGADGHADPEATAVARAAARLTRLARAQPPARPVDPQVNIDGPEVPLYPGIVQRGDVALAEASGRPLATAPDHWTDGCPVLIERIADHGPEVVMRSYLDPGSGDLLYAEVTPAGEERAFEVSPERWTTAGRDR